MYFICCIGVFCRLGGALPSTKNFFSKCGGYSKDRPTITRNYPYTNQTANLHTFFAISSNLGLSNCKTHKITKSL